MLLHTLHWRSYNERILDYAELYDSRFIDPALQDPTPSDTEYEGNHCPPPLKVAQANIERTRLQTSSLSGSIAHPVRSITTSHNTVLANALMSPSSSVPVLGAPLTTAPASPPHSNIHHPHDTPTLSPSPSPFPSPSPSLSPSPSPSPSLSPPPSPPPQLRARSSANVSPLAISPRLPP